VADLLPEAAVPQGAFARRHALAAEGEGLLRPAGSHASQEDVGVGAVGGARERPAGELDLTRAARLPGLVEEVLRLFQRRARRSGRRAALGQRPLEEGVGLFQGSELPLVQQAGEVDHDALQGAALGDGRVIRGGHPASSRCTRLLERIAAWAPALPPAAGRQ